MTAKTKRQGYKKKNKPKKKSSDDLHPIFKDLLDDWSKQVFRHIKPDKARD